MISYNDSPLTQLPQVSIPFDDLRRRMAEFSVKFDSFIERARKRVLEERNEYKARISEVHEEQRSTSAQVASLRSALSAHRNLVSREAAEKAEMNAQIDQLQTRHAAQQQTRDTLRQQIAATQSAIDHKLQAQREYARKLDGQARLNGPELLFWETYLGVRIEGAGDEGRIRVVYLFPPSSRKAKREATFELRVPDTTVGEYEVVYSRPRLDQDKVARVVRRLNETRQIGVLLKGMRGLFAEDME
ncbi:hypothetical protein DV736_g706, partial [Chaetothyriales sp. CBS 134916]